MDWALIKPFLADAELYTSLMVNTYAILLGVTYSIGWAADRFKGLRVPPGDRLGRAAADSLEWLLVIIGFLATLLGFAAILGVSLDPAALLRSLRELLGSAPPA